LSLIGTEAKQHDFAVMGLGYVGLPLAVEATLSGKLSGFGFDVSPRVVDGLNDGTSHVDDISSSTVQQSLEAGFFATTDPAQLAEAETIIICVPTPLSPEGGPDLAAVEACIDLIAEHATPGTLVVLESTTWPGTTEELVAPRLVAAGFTIGQDLFVAFSPERVDPGNPTYGLRNTPKIVSGVTDECRDRAVAFYSSFVDDVVVASGTREAEMAKLLENTYRQINIALVNEMAKFSHELGIDIWEVIRCASTKPFGFAPFRPGAGVGGHCIPIDPSYLSHRVQARLGYPFRFVELAQEINRSMPKYVARRAQDLLNDLERPVKGTRIGILGVTYKPGIADQRESPAVPLAAELLRHGAELVYFDPFVPTWRADGRDIPAAAGAESVLTGCELTIHLQPSDAYPSELIARSGAVVLDTTGSLVGERIHRL
jgi:UDP-N-acetyl-D-glucosamine dehydrogenase